MYITTNLVWQRKHSSDKNTILVRSRFTVIENSNWSCGTIWEQLLSTWRRFIIIMAWHLYLLKTDYFEVTGIIPIWRCVSTTIWLYHMDFTETPAGKAWWELHNDAAYCFEQILESAPYRTATVGPFTSHLTNHPDGMNKKCCALLEK